MGAALPGLAQHAAKVYRIGVLSEVIPRPYMSLFDMLRPLGYEEGRNLLVDFKFAQGRPELLPGLAAELVAGKPDLIAASGNPETAALKRATSSIPIVMMFASTPVETGLIASLARPGGNVTGTTMNAPQTVGKMTQLLREAVPRLSRIAWLSDPDYPGMDLYIKSADHAAAAMGLRLKHLFVRTRGRSRCRSGNACRGPARRIGCGDDRHHPGEPWPAIVEFVSQCQDSGPLFDQVSR